MMAWVQGKANEIGKEIGCRYVILDAEADMVERYKKWYKFDVIPPSKRDRKDNLFLMYFDLGLRSAASEA